MMKTRMQIKGAFYLAAMILLVLGLTRTAFSQQDETQPHTRFGGPTSVGGTLDRDSEAKGAVPFGERLLEPYFGFKKGIEKDYGLAFGLDYNALIQTATESPGEDTAAGGVLRIFGRWTLIGRDSGNTGTFVYKVENRHRLGTDLPPQSLGSEIGYAGLTAVPFSDIRWALTNLYWDQQLFNKRVAFVAGVVDTTDYVDVYGLVDPWSDFSNLAFSTDPTIPAPNQGVGAAVRFLAADQFYVLGGIADANGDPTDPGNARFLFRRRRVLHPRGGRLGAVVRETVLRQYPPHGLACGRTQGGKRRGWLGPGVFIQPRHCG